MSSFTVGQGQIIHCTGSVQIIAINKCSGLYKVERYRDGGGNRETDGELDGEIDGEINGRWIEFFYMPDSHRVP